LDTRDLNARTLSHSEGLSERWTPECIADRFDECVSVMQRLPSGLQLGCSNCWPEVTYTAKEQARHERKKHTTLRPLPEAIDRAEETLTWIIWLEEYERHLVWLRAQRISWRGIARETGLPRTSAQRYWHEALGKIEKCLINSGTIRKPRERLDRSVK